VPNAVATRQQGNEAIPPVFGDGAVRSLPLDEQQDPRHGHYQTARVAELVDEFVGKLTRRGGHQNAVERANFGSPKNVGVRGLDRRPSHFATLQVGGTQGDQVRQ
jgi:hypothetical protein